MSRIILASESVNRLNILKTAGLYPEVIPSNIDETSRKKEKPIDLAKRLSIEKGLKISSIIDNGLIISADTIVVSKGKILDKTKSAEDVRSHLLILSGGRSQIITSVVVHNVQNNMIIKFSNKIVKSICKIKNLTSDEIEYYTNSGEGIGMAGGICIEGLGSRFVTWFSGSYSAIMGLPIYETMCMLQGMGYKPL